MDNSLNTMSDMTLVNKKCITCKRELAIEMFGNRQYRSNKSDAHWIYTRYGECKDCASKRKANWRSIHPNYMKEYYKKNINKKYQIKSL
jgi:hypothetical protein